MTIIPSLKFIVRVKAYIKEEKVLIKQWRREYNQVRPHSAPGLRPPAPEAILSVVMTKQVVSLLGAGQNKGHAS